MFALLRFGFAVVALAGGVGRGAGGGLGGGALIMSVAVAYQALLVWLLLRRTDRLALE